MTISLLPFCRRLSIAPLIRLPFVSVHWSPTKFSRQRERSSILLNNEYPSNPFNSGGSCLRSLNASKCTFNILSMPLGSEGKMPCGRFIPLLNCSQKHLGQSLKMLSVLGEIELGMNEKNQWMLLNLA